MSTVIKMPKTVDTMEKFNEWIKSLNTPTQSIEITIKRRPSFYPYDFTSMRFGSRVHYLISDSVSHGISHVKNFNRIFTFKIRTH